MPELPEVETVRQTLRNFVLHHTVQNVEVLWPNIVEGEIERFKTVLQGQKLLEIDRKGKYLIFLFDNIAMISHLRMEGKYLYEPSDTPIEKHSHVIFHLDNKMDLRYHDVRKFGRLALVAKEDYLHSLHLAKVGEEPFDLDAATLKALFTNCRQPIKTALLDQSKIAGLGNIYANEVLFRAGIHPLSLACDLSLVRLQKILDTSCEVLNEAIAKGGTTIRSFSSNGIHGLFALELDVYGKENEPCCRCGATIVSQKINQRTAFYCPKCQKLIRKRKK